MALPGHILMRWAPQSPRCPATLVHVTVGSTSTTATATVFASRPLARIFDHPTLLLYRNPGAGGGGGEIVHTLAWRDYPARAPVTFFTDAGVARVSGSLVTGVFAPNVSISGGAAAGFAIDAEGRDAAGASVVHRVRTSGCTLDLCVEKFSHSDDDAHLARVMLPLGLNMLDFARTARC